MKPSAAFLKAISDFTMACNTEIDALQEKIDKEEEKESIDDEKVSALSELKDDIESAMNAAEEIETE